MPVSHSLIPVMKRKKPTRRKEEDFHHNVYVVLLSDAVAKHPSILRLNPKRDPLKPCVYVGMTGIPVDHRFENHKNGYKSAWVVRKYGVRLMPELYEHLNPIRSKQRSKWRRNWLKNCELPDTQLLADTEKVATFTASGARRRFRW